MNISHSAVYPKADNVSKLMKSVESINQKSITISLSYRMIYHLNNVWVLLDYYEIKELCKTGKNISKCAIFIYPLFECHFLWSAALAI